MANAFEKNFTEKLAKGFLEGFESTRTISKQVNTQLLSGKFGPSSGETCAFKRPTDYVTIRTSGGDITGSTASDIVTANAVGTVQDYFTEYVDYDEADEALKMDEIEGLLAPLYSRMVTDIELDFAEFIMSGCALQAGVQGTATDAWSDVANWGATMRGAGIPSDMPWTAIVNPYTEVALADTVRSLGAGGTTGGLISDAMKNATLVEKYAGMKVMSGTTLASFTSGAGADRVGVLAANPDVTYATHKNTMTQSLSLSGFQAAMVIKKGDTVKITGRNRLNLATRRPVVNALGAAIEHTATVTADVTLDGAGDGVIVVTGPAIYEAGGAFNTVDSAPVATDVVTLQSAASTLYQPNLFFHKNAFAIGSVPIKKLHSTDTIATTKDGLQFRVSKGADFKGNSQMVRIDFRPAYSVLNPFFAGHGWGK